MATRAQALAERFEQASDAVIAAAEGLSDAQWQAYCAAEQCTVAALVCHIAAVHQVGAEWVRTVAAGGSLPPVTMAMVDEQNAQLAAENAHCDKAEAIERVRRGRAEAAALIRGLGDEELDYETPFTLFGGAPVSAQSLIERILITDPVTHLPSLRAAAAQAATA